MNLIGQEKDNALFIGICRFQPLIVAAVSSCLISSCSKGTLVPFKYAVDEKGESIPLPDDLETEQISERKASGIFEPPSEGEYVGHPFAARVCTYHDGKKVVDEKAVSYIKRNYSSIDLGKALDKPYLYFGGSYSFLMNIYLENFVYWLTEIQEPPVESLSIKCGSEHASIVADYNEEGVKAVAEHMEEKINNRSDLRVDLPEGIELKDFLSEKIGEVARDKLDALRKMEFDAVFYWRNPSGISLENRNRSDPSAIPTNNEVFLLVSAKSKVAIRFSLYDGLLTSDILPLGKYVEPPYEVNWIGGKNRAYVRGKDQSRILGFSFSPKHNGVLAKLYLVE